jgi:hypothetical protein
MKNLLLLAAIVLCIGCGSNASRNTHTTLEGVGRSVDLAEREYVEGVLMRRYSTNRFPEVQRGYAAFQTVFSNAVWFAARSTNNVGVPPEVRAKANDVLSEINQAKGAK